jgi:hypothetical protein
VILLWPLTHAPSRRIAASPALPHASRATLLKTHFFSHAAQPFSANMRATQHPTFLLSSFTSLSSMATHRVLSTSPPEGSPTPKPTVGQVDSVDDAQSPGGQNRIPSKDDFTPTRWLSTKGFKLERKGRRDEILFQQSKRQKNATVEWAQEQPRDLSSLPCMPSDVIHKVGLPPSHGKRTSVILTESTGFRTPLRRGPHRALSSQPFVQKNLDYRGGRSLETCTKSSWCPRATRKYDMSTLGFSLARTGMRSKFQPVHCLTRVLNAKQSCRVMKVPKEDIDWLIRKRVCRCCKLAK